MDKDITSEVKRRRIRQHEKAGAGANDSSDDDKDNVTDRALSIDLIAEKIFDYLTKDELLNSCSFVSKLWNFQARGFLRRKHKCILYMNFYEDTYKDLENVTTILTQSFCLPYRGLSVMFPSRTTAVTEQPRKEEKAKLWKNFEDAVSEKFVHLEHMQIFYGSCKHEAAGIEGVTGRVGHRLHSLFLFGKRRKDSTFNIQQGALKNITKLKEFHFPYDANPKDTLNLIQMVIQGAPNLQRLWGTARVDWLEHLCFWELVNKGLLKEFVFSFKPKDLPVLRDFAGRGISAEKLSLKCGTSSWRPWSAELLQQARDIMHQLLVTSAGTLRRLHIAMEEFLFLETSRRFPLCEHLETLLFSTIRASWLDFCNLSYFPNLRRIIIDVGKSGDLSFGRPPPDTVRMVPLRYAVVETVTTICLVDGGGSLFFNWQIVFPNVRHVYIRSDRPAVVTTLLRLLWVTWPRLETINIYDIRLSRLTASWDNVICGISATEANSLRRHRPEVLASMNLAPTQPSIRNKTKLTTLRMEVVHDAPSSRRVGKVVFSKVSTAIAFSRMPGLCIELYRIGASNVNPAFRFNLDHLNSVVKLKCRDCPMFREDTDYLIEDY